MTALLLRYNADPRATDKYGGTPLHSAGFNCRSDIIPLLVAEGCEVNAQNKWYGFAPLHVAASLGDVPSLTLLMSANADSSLVDTFGNTLLHLAVANNHLEAVSFLASQPGAPLNKRTNDNRTALQRACYNGRPDIVRVLLGNNAAFDNVGYYQMLAYYPGTTDAQLLSTLLEFGCPASKLLFNKFSGTTEPFSVLLDAGCDVDETGRDGIKPLHFAAQRGYTKAISLLAAEGANLHAVDAAGWTPLHYAAAMEKDPHFRNDLGLNRLIFLGADVNAVNKAGQTPLHMAADKMRIDTIDALVQQGCNVHIRDNDGQSALDLFEAAIISPDLLMLQTVDHVRHLLATITMTPKRSERSCVVS
eukprot:GILJ01015033.1.p1 GENE.GILJ01015033.1~~GILJ01015033.1.p1  ORF type:complete len:361 (-),score=34.87 GILJ01015033.1:325-1407(-)